MLAADTEDRLARFHSIPKKHENECYTLIPMPLINSKCLAEDFKTQQKQRSKTGTAWTVGYSMVADREADFGESE